MAGLFFAGFASKKQTEGLKRRRWKD